MKFNFNPVAWVANTVVGFLSKYSVQQEEIIGLDMNKQMQSSDWGAEKLSEKQLKYAASDVIHLHTLKKELNKMLIREKRDFLFQECLKFLNTRVDLDLADYKNDIFSH